MIHVLNPYQLSTAMFRLANYTLETQMAYLKVMTQVASSANPMVISRAAILKKPCATETTGADAAPAPKPKAPRRKPAAKAATPKLAVMATPEGGEPKKYRAPSTPPTMPAMKSGG